MHDPVSNPPWREGVLYIHHPKHALVKQSEEVVHRVLQVQFPRLEVFVKLIVELDKNIRVLFVQYPVRPTEHGVEVLPTVVEKLAEYLC